MECRTTGIWVEVRLLECGSSATVTCSPAGLCEAACTAGSGRQAGIGSGSLEGTPELSSATGKGLCLQNKWPVFRVGFVFTSQFG